MNYNEARYYAEERDGDIPFVALRPADVWVCCGLSVALFFSAIGIAAWLMTH